MPFIHDDFALDNAPARRLYHKFAERNRFSTITATFRRRTSRKTGSSKTCLKSGWRATITNGARCAATAWRKNSAPAAPRRRKIQRLGQATVPHTLRNPLYHWTHLELKRYFGISDLLSEKTAAKIWRKANAQLATPAFTTQGILKKMKVKVVCTTDDPVDDLEHHRAFAAQGHPTKMLPAFRPDKALRSTRPRASTNGWSSWPPPRTRTSTVSAPSSARWKSGTSIFIRRAAGCPTTA
jgi:glucuronate isomerase